ncbi:PREDICTED: uncharacterized protein LOC106747823 isoform X2 [Dinoponera quadriceps]|uniref:Uncharacterized protein LOC106747823 isoform X2 n=1 Tax=Dinoponera quadriceps TaxID=609295 RepID=A0A6P3XRV1_DINQU|nr:PREDICTED: uncharacterized protein LOC106747823 isoform X2 [Dinoponera quadriceps]
MNSDYYSTIYAWFERCGIISNIRTHLRQNLVNALKGKDLGLCQSKEARSAKQLKLQSDYIEHTLETLGIDPKKPEAQGIISSYLNSEAPLLLSILNCINSLMVGAQSSVREGPLYDKETQANLALEADIGARRVQTMRRKIMRQKQLYDDELRMKENKLTQQASIIKHQLGSLNAKLKEAQDLMQSLTLKEKQLNEKEDNEARNILQREMELSMKQNFLTQEANRLQKERDSYRKFEGDLKKLQRELVKMQKEMSQGAPSQNCQATDVRNIHVQTESRALMDECKALQREKVELSNLVQEQRTRIEQITMRSVQLSRQLEEVRSLRSVVGVEAPVVSVSANAIVVSESSSTEDILQDAKMRLKRLEEESSKADQYFCSFVSASS